MELIPQNPTKMNHQLSDRLAVLDANKKSSPFGRAFFVTRLEAKPLISFTIG